MTYQQEPFYDLVIFAARSQAFFTRNWSRRTADAIDRLRGDVLHGGEREREAALDELRKLKPANPVEPEEGIAHFLAMVDMSLSLWGLVDEDEGPTELSRIGKDLVDAATSRFYTSAALDELLEGSGDGDLTDFRSFEQETPMPRRPDQPSHLSVVRDPDEDESPTD